MGLHFSSLIIDTGIGPKRNGVEGRNKQARKDWASGGVR